MSEKQEYEQKLEAKLEEWQANIDKLRAQAKQAGSDAQAEYEKQLDELRKRRDEMEVKLQELRDAQVAAWSDIKDGADKAWDNMSKAMQDAWKRLS